MAWDESQLQKKIEGLGDKNTIDTLNKVLEEAESVFEIAREKPNVDETYVRREYEEVRLAILEEFFWLTVDREEFKKDMVWYVEELAKKEPNNPTNTSLDEKLNRVLTELNELKEVGLQTQVDSFKEVSEKSLDEIQNLLTLEYDKFVLNEIDEIIDIYKIDPDWAIKILKEKWVTNDNKTESWEWHLDYIINRLKRLNKNSEKVKDINETVENLNKSDEERIKTIIWNKITYDELIKKYKDAINKNTSYNIQDLKTDLENSWINELESTEIINLLWNVVHYQEFQENYNEIETLKEEKKEIYFKEKEYEIENILSNSNQTSMGEDDNFSNNILTDESWHYWIKSSDWESFKISDREWEAAKNNKDAYQNLINMREVLINLNLEFVWNFREDFYIASWSKNWPLFLNPYDSNWVKKSELINFLNYLLETLWYKEKNTNLSWCIAKLRWITWSWLDNKKKDYMWDTTIENIYEAVWYLDQNGLLRQLKREEMNIDANRIKAYNLINWISNWDMV